MQANFTIRVYGIFVKDGRVLLSKEKHGDKEMLKFPGGGLEFGEGTIECLKREMQEEFNMHITVVEHFYTTDFFVASAFHQDTQVMSIYYTMQPLIDEIQVNTLFKDECSEQYLLWQALDTLDPQSLTFPIDQKVAAMLKPKRDQGC